MESLIDVAMADPLRSLKEAELLLTNSDIAAQAHVYRAMGVAHRRLGDLEASSRLLATSVELGRSLADSQLEALCSISLAATTLLQGDSREAIEMLRAITETASGEISAEAWFQLGTAHAQLGNLDDAAQCYGVALPLVRRHRLTSIEVELIGNRALVHHLRGRYRDARRDFEKADELFTATSDMVRKLPL